MRLRPELADSQRRRVARVKAPAVGHGGVVVREESVDRDARRQAQLPRYAHRCAIGKLLGTPVHS